MAKDPVQQLMWNLRAKGGNPLPTSSLGRCRNGHQRGAHRIGLVRLRGEELTSVRCARAVARLVETLGELKGVAMESRQILSYVDGHFPQRRAAAACYR